MTESHHAITADYMRGYETSVSCSCGWQSPLVRGLLNARSAHEQHRNEQGGDQ